MPLGKVDDIEFEKELEKLRTGREPLSNHNGRVVEVPNLGIARVIPKPDLGRGENNVEVPEALRNIIGETALEIGNKDARALTEMIGGDISQSAVSAYKNGATSTSTYGKAAPGLFDHMLRTRGRISRKASDKLNRALNHITDDKLEDQSPKDLAAIAKDMSAIIKNMEPPVEKIGEGHNVGVAITFMAPRPRGENQYETITLSE